MKFDYRATARFMRVRLIEKAWTTSQQKWTSSCALGGLILTTLLMPPLGISVLGTAFAGWWLGVFVLTIFCGLVGNRIGIGKEKAAFEKDKNV